MFFDWFFRFPPAIIIILVCFLISLLIVVAYKYTTNQKEMKQLSEEQKKYQKEMKESKNDPSKLMEIQKKAMGANMKYMSHSFKSNLYTFIPLLLIFGWLNGVLVYQPIEPNTMFNVTVYATYDVNITTTSEPRLDILGMEKEGNVTIFTYGGGAAGDYVLWFEANNQKVSKEIIITHDQKYKNPQTVSKDGAIKKIVVSLKPMRPFGEKFNLFGWRPGWLGTYIIFSFIFSMLIRKLMKVY